MTTRMIHPQHGATHAYGVNDVAYHQARGWVIDDGSTAKKPAPVEPVAEVPAIERQKPGPKPKAK